MVERKQQVIWASDKSNLYYLAKISKTDEFAVVMESIKREDLHPLPITVVNTTNTPKETKITIKFDNT